MGAALNAPIHDDIDAIAHGIDNLGELIERTRLRGRVFCQSLARPPWGLRFPAAPQALFHLITAGNVEGGDFMVLEPGVAACGYSGERSIEPAVAQLKQWFEAEGWEFHTYAFDAHFLHLDVQMGMLAEGLAVVCAEAVEPELLAWLRSKRIRVLDIPYADAMLVALPADLDPVRVASVSDNVPDGWRAVAPELEHRPGAPVLVVGGAGDVALYGVAVAVALESEQVDYVDTDEQRLAIEALDQLAQPIDLQIMDVNRIVDAGVIEETIRQLCQLAGGDQ